MSQDLVPVNHRDDDVRPERFDANLEPLKAGQYWKTSKDVPAKVKVTREKKYRFHGSDEDDEFYDNTQTLRRALQQGLVLLIQNLRHDDMGLHTVIVAAHPLWENQDPIRFLASEFYEYFEREFEAEQVRTTERLQVEGRLLAIQQDIAAGPPPEQVAALLEAPNHNPNPSVEVMVKHVKELATAKTQMLAVAETAKKHQEFIKEKTQEVSSTVKLLTRFYTENAAAKLASVSDVIEYSAALMKGVATMGLYTGEGVEISTWAKGKSAAADERIHLFQNQIFLEEEFMVHLHDGGMDYKKLPQFIKALNSEDKTLRDRILPYPRTIVMARIRRRAATYQKEGTPGAAYENMMANQPNLEGFLLIRDGENVYQVWSELSTDKANQLFPSKNDVDEIFAGIDGRQTAVNDLTYTDKLAKHDDYALFYKRLLVLLWGLNDNHTLFGDFYDPSEYRGFFDQGFQTKYFNFIYEDGIVLGTQRPTYKAWFREMNSYLQSGARVLVNLDSLFGPDSCPGAYSSYGYGSQKGYNQTWKYVGPNAQLLVAKRQGSEYYVEVESEYNGYRRERDIKRDKNPTLKVFLTADKRERGLNDHLQFPYLVLDMVKPDDIEFYKHSRSNRQYYAEYMDTLFKVEALAKAEFASEAPFKQALIEAAEAGRLPIPEGSSLSDTADHAIRLYRATRRGERTPNPTDEGWKSAMKSAMASLYQLLGAGFNPLDHVPGFVEQQGLTPIRFVMTGKGKFALYVVTPDDEQETRLYRHVWVTRISLERTKDALVEYSRKLVILPRVSAEEQVLKEWPENVGEWAKQVAPDNLDTAKINRMIDSVDVNLDRLDVLDGDFDWEQLYRQATYWVRQNSKGHVALPIMVVPLAIHCRQDDPTPYEISEYSMKKFNRVVVYQNVFGLLAKYADDEQFQRLLKWPATIYANPESGIKGLQRLRTETKPELAVYFADAGGKDYMEQGGHWGAGWGIPVNWQDYLNSEGKTHYSNKPKRTYPEAVPYMSARALKWLNDHATAPAQELKK